MEEKFYLTKRGLENIKKEYEELKQIEFSETKKEFSQLLQSSNLDFLQTKIIELENILKNVELIKKPSKQKRNIVNLGAGVTLKEKDGQNNEFIIVGELEANPDEGKISFRSPVGKALLGRKVGDEIIVICSKRTVYKIMKIKYDFM
ncbi:MAG: GreA/GreB family elongation factor [Minisyncoccales bacterium]